MFPRTYPQRSAAPRLLGQEPHGDLLDQGFQRDAHTADIQQGRAHDEVKDTERRQEIPHEGLS